MRNPESRITCAILRALNALPGTKCVKLEAGGVEVGTPDLLCVSHGLAFFLEVKQPGEKPRPIQQHRLDEWRRAGAICAVVTSAQEALQVVWTGDGRP